MDLITLIEKTINHMVKMYCYIAHNYVTPTFQKKLACLPKEPKS
jgi:hypothetical protein